MRLYRFNFRFAIIACAVACLIVFSSCKDTINSVSSLDEIVFPATGISYTKQVQPLFNVGCALTGCHDNVTKQANLDLSSYYGVISAPGVIARTGNPVNDTTNSRLVWSIEAKPGSSPMPPARPLSQNQIQGLKRWIFEGAKDTQ